MESFFSTLILELIYFQDYANRKDPRTDFFTILKDFTIRLVAIHRWCIYPRLNSRGNIMNTCLHSLSTFLVKTQTGANVSCHQQTKPSPTRTQSVSAPGYLLLKLGRHASTHTRSHDSSLLG